MVRQVRQRLPHGSQATLLAVDGSTTGSVRGQLRHVPANATHLVLRVGGNDALRSGDFLASPPLLVQRVRFGLLATIGKLLGYKARYLPTAVLRSLWQEGKASAHRRAPGR